MTDKPNVFRDMAAIAGGDFDRAIEIMAGFTAFANSGLAAKTSGDPSKPVQPSGGAQPSVKVGGTR